MIADETQILTKPANESRAFNVSIRAWVCLLVTLTICYMSVAELEIREPLYTLGGMVIGYYFAQKEKPKTAI